ncbi:TOBE domain-containing protein [Noviherbaspirillum sp. Root189]|uniref:TOBE domain-containing protein n=1 Tax=Noviherbaspirillum sp. Root189 TaxID=1736487 RepID=UPI00070ACB9F|nr:TOBE domain-containing protein [Noviherbaspirillum sp. Root189]KRB93812.1 hypothetical protein ASE07_12155 [Noviherbaspirillum sp. Root189]
MNQLPGQIVTIDSHGSIALVDAIVAGQRFTAMLIGAGEEVAAWEPGMDVTLLFKEVEVSLAKNLMGQISLRNRIACTVTSIEHGRLMSRVMMDFQGYRIASVITTRSAQALAIAPGVSVEALIKANEMTVVPAP